MRPSSMTFLADECISPVMIDYLCDIGAECLKSLHRGYWKRYLGKADEEWLPDAAKRNCVILTCDRNMSSSDTTARLLEQHGARVIFLGRHFANSKKWDQTLWMLKYWSKINDIAANMAPGDMVRMRKNGRADRVIVGGRIAILQPTSVTSNLDNRRAGIVQAGGRVED